MKTDNELIAEFMDCVFKKEIDGVRYYDVPGSHIESYNAAKGKFAYHKRWDWLMPVVGKINESCKDTGYPDGLEICDWHVIAVANNIKLVYFSVVEFINWYNENVKNSKLA